MGMTIDEIIGGLKETVAICDSVYAYDRQKYIVEAINTMRKYQRIEQIARWNNAPSPYYKPDGQLFREISEVLEDRNDNNKV